MPKITPRSHHHQNNNLNFFFANHQPDSELKMAPNDVGFVMYAMEKSGTPCTKLLNPSANQPAKSSSSAPAPGTSQTSQEEVRYSTESEVLVKGMA